MMMGVDGAIQSPDLQFQRSELIDNGLQRACHRLTDGGPLCVLCQHQGLVIVKRNYHHGDLRAAVLKAAASEIERRGFETLSLRELASLIGVAHSAPYRHFADRDALLAALAAQGFADC
jgi:hypothetical protein